MISFKLDKNPTRCSPMLYSLVNAYISLIEDRVIELEHATRTSCGRILSLQAMQHTQRAQYPLKTAYTLTDIKDPHMI